MPIAIRPATSADQSTIKRIVREARINPTSIDWQRFLVADDAGQIVGVGQIKPHGDDSRELASIATISERQRQGIAAQIIRTLIARETGVLYLTCRPELETFYTRFGFRRVEPSAMSPYFRRLYRFATLFGLSRQHPWVIVMRRLP